MPRGRFVLITTASVALCMCALLPGSTVAASSRTITVQVNARDFAFALSRKSVPAGSKVRFVVHNRGSTVHDFVLRSRHSRLLEPGETQAITVSFAKKGAFRFLCSVPGHAGLGMSGVFGVSRKPPPAPNPPPVDTSDAAMLTRVGTFERPVLVTAPPGDTRRIFVVEQTGAVRIVRDGITLPEPFLDLRDEVKLSSEPGLLSIAFAPDYAVSGRFYVFYNSTQGNGDIRISEFRRHPTDPELADPYSERTLLTIVKPWENHNGGMLQFGPDDFLYASIGDGDSGVLNPPGYFAQRRDDLLGNILRIDPRKGDPYAVPADNPFVGLDGVRPEIWAYGLRNPWRFWIDAVTRSMFIADAGNERREEVDLVPLDESGANLGWPCFEGTLPFDATTTCSRPVPPLLEYPRGDDACAVIGGVVARDPRLPALAGRYLFGDFCSGKITALEAERAQVKASGDLGLVVPELTSFGVDGARRIYVMSLRGDVYRLDSKRET
ncbi:MAG: PQQ-dependent sugar dehydrogenase [Gaiellaceae bacterium]